MEVKNNDYMRVKTIMGTIKGGNKNPGERRPEKAEPKIMIIEVKEKKKKNNSLLRGKKQTENRR